MKFRCIIPTFLKKADQSSFLSNDGKQGFETGETFEAVAFEGLADEAMPGSRLPRLASDGRSTCLTGC